MKLHCAGKHLDRSTVAYDKVGTRAFQSFSILSAMGTIAFSFGDVSFSPAEMKSTDDTSHDAFKESCTLISITICVKKP